MNLWKLYSKVLYQVLLLRTSMSHVHMIINSFTSVFLLKLKCVQVISYGNVTLSLWDLIQWNMTAIST